MELIVENVKKSFDNKKVLKNINFTFKKGKIYGLLGRNGAGKTTLFNLLNEDLKVDSGNFYLLQDNQKKVLSNKDIGYVVSTPNVPEFLTAREFLRFFLDINASNIQNPKTIDEYFDYMKIDKSDRDKLLKDYSHGMKNKMQMLINIISKPNILLLDEPLTSLDVIVAEEMKSMLRKIKKDHIIIFSTHIMDLALNLCDEIILLTNGELVSIDESDLNEAEVKEKIINILKDEDNYVE